MTVNGDVPIPAVRIVIDVGNSRTKFGLFDGIPTQAESLAICLQNAVAGHADPLPWDTIQNWVSQIAPEQIGGIIAGTNPDGIQRVAAEWPEDWPPLVRIDDPTKLPIVNRTDAPHKVGVDRLLNCIATNAVRPTHQPAIVISSGTATTVDVLSTQGEFEGGAILPGFELLARSLHEYTAALPMIPIEELVSESHDPLGRNTRAALRSGIYWTQIGAIKELMQQLTSANGIAADDLMVVLCGGGARLLADYLPRARWEPHLPLQGLVAVAEAGA